MSKYSDNQVYYARSKNEKGEKETVKHHLKRVAELCEIYASAFGEEENGKTLGAIHDMGKLSTIFRQVLNKKITGVNHSIAGAYILYINKEKILGKIAYAHHGYLDNISDSIIREYEIGKITEDEKGKIFSVPINELQDCYNFFIKDIDDELSKNLQLNDVILPRIKNQNLETMLYMRMMLSCLVDADYSASAEHFDKEYLKKSTGAPLDAKKFLGSLLETKNNLGKNSTADIKINAIRNDVFEQCLNAALKPTGIFTLTAPTGTGKTFALMAFALNHAIEHGKKRIIIVLPFLSIIEQNAKVYSDICGEILEAHSNVKFEKDNDSETIRMYSERWSVPVIITTSVNFFEGFFKDKASDCRRLHNICESVIVFDEAQSIPIDLVDSTIKTIIQLAENYNSTVLLSTATQPAFTYRPALHSIWHPTEIIKNQEDLFQQTKRTEIVWNLKNSVSLEEIAQQMNHSDSCCAIVNLKKHCKKLYSILSGMADKKSVFSISTNMCTAHRKNVLSQIQSRLKNNLPCRIISTQCIEAGIDLDVQKLFRALAPLDAIIQSAGRCNRNGKIASGEVIVFEPDEEGRKYPTTAYEISAIKVKSMLAEKMIDINNPADIQEYYRRLYAEYDTDNKELLNAYENMDFQTAQKKYKFIDNGGVKVIVPYHEKMDLYNEVTIRARESFTPLLMKQAQEITVTTYDTDKVNEICERIYIYTEYGKEATDWYILNNREMYVEDGLALDYDKISSIC